ncbi:MAG: hypothetical protein NW217_03865 [Hyphomicrobiaceae bacterium]|nr:hypothetical protein [Hyphomicrobiaceae bacterium]
MHAAFRLCAITAALVALWFSAAHAKDEIFANQDAYVAHMEFLGYKVEPLKQSINFTHPTNWNVSLKKYAGGLLMTAQLNVSELDDKKRNILLSIINKFNADAILVRFYLSTDEKSTLIEALYQGDYDRARFGEFVASFNASKQQATASSEFRKFWK